MCKVIIPLAIAAVLVSATTSTLSIPVFSEGSEIVIRDGEESSPPEAEGHRMLRGKNEANQEAQEERGRLPIPREAFEAFEASSSEALRTMNKNVADAEAQMKWANALFKKHPVASSYAEKLRVKVDDVAKSLGILWKRKDKSTVNDEKLLLMAVGHMYFKAREKNKPPKPRTYAVPTGHNLFRDHMDKELFATWKSLLKDYKPNVIFGKMLLLKNAYGDVSTDIKDLVNYAYMAMGSEMLSRKKSKKRVILPLPTGALENSASTQRAVDSPKTKQLLEQLRGDSPALGETDEQPLTEAAKKAVGKDLTLGRGE